MPKDVLSDTVEASKSVDAGPEELYEPDSEFVESLDKMEQQIISGEPDSIFINSVNLLTDSDIAENDLNKKKSNLTYYIFRYFILILCAGVFCYSGYNFVLHLISYAQSSAEYDEIRNMFHSGTEEVLTGAFIRLSGSPRMYEVLSSEGDGLSLDGYEVEVIGSELDRKLNSLADLKKRNSDTYGWLYVAMTNIDYPVMQGPDNDFYLSRNFNKYYQFSGSIFVDYRNSRNMENNFNTVIYGHNMNNNTMFRQILLFRDKREVFQKSYIELTTPEGVFVYKPFSFYDTDPYYRYIQTEFYSDEEWLEFLLEIQAKSRYATDIKLTADDRIITLSTCTNTPNDYRYALHAVLVEVKNAE